MRSDTARAVRYRAVVDVRDSGRVSTRMHRMLPVVPSTNMTGDNTLHNCWAKFDVIVAYIKLCLWSYLSFDWFVFTFVRNDFYIFMKHC